MNGTTDWLALDFDGVVVDAILECAAVTAAARHPGGELPALMTAVDELTPDYLALFASVRPHSRTLPDFMVTNTVDAPIRTRAEFEAAKHLAGQQLLNTQAAQAQRARDRWRSTEPKQWLSLHQPFDGIPGLIRHWQGPVCIVSSKDADSIEAILTHFDLASNVTTIVGECRDKACALRELLRAAQTATFIDDNIDNVVSVSGVTGVSVRWATWGYHSQEDTVTAQHNGVRPIELENLADVA